MDRATQQNIILKSIYLQITIRMVPMKQKNWEALLILRHLFTWQIKNLIANQLIN